jgi:hypothetical protein
MTYLDIRATTTITVQAANSSTNIAFAVWCYDWTVFNLRRKTL